MVLVNYPEPGFRIKNEAGKDFVFDALRKKWIILTPEEWVRQNFTNYLLLVKQYPATLLALEKLILLGEMKKRFDILVYNKDHQPWMMIECKSSQVVLDDSTVEQVLRYNISVPVEYIVVTNGPTTYCWQRKDGKFRNMTELPDWPLYS